jgi:hypothetical protein
MFKSLKLLVVGTHWKHCAPMKPSSKVFFRVLPALLNPMLPINQKKAKPPVNAKSYGENEISLQIIKGQVQMSHRHWEFGFALVHFVEISVDEDDEERVEQRKHGSGNEKLRSRGRIELNVEVGFVVGLQSAEGV